MTVTSEGSCFKRFTRRQADCSAGQHSLIHSLVILKAILQPALSPDMPQGANSSISSHLRAHVGNTTRPGPHGRRTEAGQAHPGCVLLPDCPPSITRGRLHSTPDARAGRHFIPVTTTGPSAICPSFSSALPHAFLVKRTSSLLLLLAANRPCDWTKLSAPDPVPVHRPRPEASLNTPEPSSPSGLGRHSSTEDLFL